LFFLFQAIDKIRKDKQAKIDRDQKKLKAESRAAGGGKQEEPRKEEPKKEEPKKS